MIVQQNEDEENEDDHDAGSSSITNQANVLVEVLLSKISSIEKILQSEQDGPLMQNSVTDEKFVPLGQQRLRSVELVLKMLQMKKDVLNTAIASSKIPLHIMSLIKAYPWNNFLQLKVINIWTEVLENQDNNVFTS